MIRLFIAIIVGKLVLLATRILAKTGGSAAPGLIALQIDPHLITKLASKIETNIVITGTNGKTTTSAILAQILGKSKRIIHNNTGSNLSRGIASKLLAVSSSTGTINADVGIWEADEAAFVDIVENIKPHHIVILNIARDQLDRYGEINTVIQKWNRTLGKARWTKTLYLNADDGNVYGLSNVDNSRVQTFGIEHTPVQFEKPAKDPRYDVKARILETTIEHVEFVFSHDGFGQKITLPIAGVYNVYNFLAAYLVSAHLGISSEDVVNAVESFTPAFGRMERVLFGKTEGLIALIKNPAGATQVIHTITSLLKKEDHVVIILNDNIADGTDVSWIWDTDFEKMAPHVSMVSVTGTRRYDMALRLYYAGVEKENIIISDSVDEVIAMVRDDPTSSLHTETSRGKHSRLFILPTYTALLELQKYLTKKGYKEKHWHE